MFCSEAYDETRSNYCLQSTGELVNPVSLNMCANTGAVPGAVVALSVFASDQPGTLFYDAFGRTVPPAGSFQVGSTPVEHGTQIVTGLCGTVSDHIPTRLQPDVGASVPMELSDDVDHHTVHRQLRPRP